MPPKRKTVRARRRSTPDRKSPRSHLLIIECDSHTLMKQGMHLGSGFSRIIKPLFPNKRIAIVQTSTEDQLREDLAKVFHEFGCFRSILIVGHSNTAELMLSTDGSRPWSTVGEWIKIFEPDFLFLAACEAGNSVAVRTVFAAVPTLKQIYGSPVPLYKIHTGTLAILIGMLLATGRLDAEQSQAVRIAHYITSGGQVYRWRRSEAGPGQELTCKLWDAIGTSFDFGPWDWIGTLVGDTRK